MKAPIELLFDPSVWNWLFAVLFLASLVLSSIMLRFQGLGGVFDFELAFTRTRAEAYFKNYLKTEEKLKNAEMALKVDFPFTLFLHLLLSVICTMISTSINDWVLPGTIFPAKWVAAFFAWAVLVAMLCDFVENTFLLMQIDERKRAVKEPSALYPAIAGIFSLDKWLIDIAVVVFCLIALIYPGIALWALGFLLYPLALLVNWGRGKFVW